MQGSPVYRLIKTEDTHVIIVFGINELFGVDKDQPYQAQYALELGVDETSALGFWLTVTAEYDLESSLRTFSIFFNLTVDGRFLEVIVDGAQIIFTSAPAPINLIKSPTFIDLDDVQAVLNEYGGCHINTNSHTRSVIQTALGSL